MYQRSHFWLSGWWEPKLITDSIKIRIFGRTFLDPRPRNLTTLLCIKGAQIKNIWKTKCSQLIVINNVNLFDAFFFKTTENKVQFYPNTPYPASYFCQKPRRVACEYYTHKKSWPKKSFCIVVLQLHKLLAYKIDYLFLRFYGWSVSLNMHPSKPLETFILRSRKFESFSACLVEMMTTKINYQGFRERTLTYFIQMYRGK